MQLFHPKYYIFPHQTVTYICADCVLTVSKHWWNTQYVMKTLNLDKL